MRISDWSSDVCSSDLLHPSAALISGAPFHAISNAGAAATERALGTGCIVAASSRASSVSTLARSDASSARGASASSALIACACAVSGRQALFVASSGGGRAWGRERDGDGTGGGEVGSSYVGGGLLKKTTT